MARKSTALVAIKVLHTAVWLIMASAVVAIPILGWEERFRWAFALTALVLVECGVLAVNRGRCPLTDAALRYTEPVGDNFDIFLPNWLARYNKLIFGSLFLAGEIILIWRWLR